MLHKQQRLIVLPERRLTKSYFDHQVAAEVTCFFYHAPGGRVVKATGADRFKLTLITHGFALLHEESSQPFVPAVLIHYGTNVGIACL